MDAKKLLKEWKRMCDTMDDARYDVCEKCLGGKINCTCLAFEMSDEDIDTIVKTVEEWSEENPIRTYKDVFLEKFPDARLGKAGMPMCCAANIFGDKHFSVSEGADECAWINKDCKDCWNREYKGD